MPSDVERYISDNSLRLFGLADRSIIDYVLASASSAKTPDALFSSLHASGLPDTPDAHEFINTVFTQAPRKHKHKRSAAEKAQRQAEKDSKSLRSQKFDLLLEDDTADVQPLPKEKRPKEKKERDRHTRKRDYDDKEWESDEEEQVRKRSRVDDSAMDVEEPEPEFPEEDEAEKKERERLDDLKDRDAFAERVRDRDRERTKKIVEDRSSKKSGAAATEAAERRQLADDADARGIALPSLRLHSRQEYLTKREIQQIELLRKEIADDEALFSGMKISKRERRELDRKKELLKLVEERMKINDTYDGYQLPEDYFTEQGKIDKEKKKNALYRRYEEAKPKDDQFVTDVDQWEAAQTQHSTFKMGAMDKRELVEDYEYVFDESQTIQFVMDQTLSGNNKMTAAEKLLQDQIDAAEKRGLSRRLEKACRFTNTGISSLTLSKSIRFSLSSPKLDQEKPHSYPSTFTKQDIPKADSKSGARSLDALPPCLLLPVLLRRWERKWAMK
ncbi:hypothetical protein BDZ89DRAFT_520515 [Hymenopellis radicata]|nr:hypothetical protein BDZ89DRAFT_520515 [Hymenopellis radicata]